MDLEAYLITANELDAWEPAYPGDPMTRQAGIYVTMETNHPKELDQWFKNSLGTKAVRTHPEDDNLLHQPFIHDFKMIYRVEDKTCVMQIKLAFPMADSR